MWWSTPACSRRRSCSPFPGPRPTATRQKPQAARQHVKCKMKKLTQTQEQSRRNAANIMSKHCSNVWWKHQHEQNNQKHDTQTLPTHNRNRWAWMCYATERVPTNGKRNRITMHDATNRVGDDKHEPLNETTGMRRPKLEMKTFKLSQTVTWAKRNLSQCHKP